MATESSRDGENEELSSARDRSPRFPFVPLGRALERAKEFYDKEGRNPASPAVAAGHWGYSPKSSGFKQTLAALRYFGLLESKGTGIRLSSRALRIILDQRQPSKERDELLREAALLPAIHGQLWQRFTDGFPSDANLRHILLFDYQFNERSISDFVAEFKSSLSFAGLSLASGAPGGSPDSSLSLQPDSLEESLTQPRVPDSPRKGDGPADSSGVSVAAPELGPQTPGTRQDVFSLPEGQAVLRWPESISQESFYDFKGWLELVLRRVGRSAGVPALDRRFSAKTDD